MGLKLGQNITFRPFLSFCSVIGRDTASWSRHRSRHRFVATQLATQVCATQLATQVCRDTVRDTGLSRHQIWTATGFSSLTCRGHNFFVLTRIWACEYSLESSLNVECSHEGIGTILCSRWYRKINLPSSAL